ncbi:MAG: signal peptidase II [Acidobacteriota bacterium]|nr:signal peptidase II [Acidobacteriota bacterium]MDE3168517.1 signal peptidase II [Acidobacteriota bacterium]
MAGVSRSGWALGLLAAAVLAADQLSKLAVGRFTSPGSFQVIIPGILNLVHTSNPGVAFGLFADSQAPWRAPLLIVFSVIVIGLIIWMLWTHRSGGVLGSYGLASILGGAAGNVVDRVFHRSVTDFIDFHLGSYHWYTFNVADTAIVIGAALVILELLRDGRRVGQEHA